MSRTEEQKAIRREQTKLNREYLRRVHRCRDCLKIDAFTMMGRAKCADCVKKDNERHRAPEYTEKAKENQKKIREHRRIEHKCTRCGGGLREEYSYSTCDLCRKKMREAKHIRYMKKTKCNYPRGDNGFCWQCNKELCIDGKHLCQKCYDEKMKIVDKMNEINQAEKRFVWTMASMWATNKILYEAN